MSRLSITPSLLLALCAGLALTALGGCVPRQVVIDLAPTGPDLVRSNVIDEAGLFGDRVALIDVSGLILNAEQPRLLGAGEHPVSLLHEQLGHAADDRRVQAVILRINSPGGTVTASEAMYREVERFRARTGKPVVALLMDVAASGGYYVACAGDTIVAYPTSLTGSVGVVVQTFSLKRGMDRIGIDSEAIVSGPNKDVASPFTTMTDEHRQVLQALVDDYYDRFVETVRQQRPDIPADHLDEAIDGRVVSGDRAVTLGLADETGDVYDAFARAKELAGVERADLVRYHRPRQHVPSPYAAAPGAEGSTGGPAQFNMLQFNLEHLPGLGAPPGIYYLWRPDVQ